MRITGKQRKNMQDESVLISVFSCGLKFGIRVHCGLLGWEIVEKSLGVTYEFVSSLFRFDVELKMANQVL